MRTDEKEDECLDSRGIVLESSTKGSYLCHYGPHVLTNLFGKCKWVCKKYRRVSAHHELFPVSRRKSLTRIADGDSYGRKYVEVRRSERLGERERTPTRANHSRGTFRAG